MTTLNELEALAKAMKAVDPRLLKPTDGVLHWNYYDAVTPSNILALIELCRMQHEHIEHFVIKQKPMDGHYFYEAIAAFESFGKE